MILIVMFVLCVFFEFYFQSLGKEAIRLTNAGLTFESRSRWNDIKRTTAWMSPWVGFTRFVSVIVLYALVECLMWKYLDFGIPNIVWPLCVVIALGHSYNLLLPAIYAFVLQLFKGDEGPGKPRWWMIRMRWSHVKQGIQYKYPYTFAFIILSLRLFVCNTIGHRWTKMEHIKYGDFGMNRTCKLCKINHTSEKGEDRYCETHGRQWRRIQNPDAVLFRKYVPLTQGG